MQIQIQIQKIRIKIDWKFETKRESGRRSPRQTMVVGYIMWLHIKKQIQTQIQITKKIQIWNKTRSRRRMRSETNNGGRLDYVITYSCSVIPYLRRGKTRNRNGPETCKTGLDWDQAWFSFYSRWMLVASNEIHVFVSTWGVWVTNWPTASSPGGPEKVSTTIKHDKIKYK